MGMCSGMIMQDVITKQKPGISSSQAREGTWRCIFTGSVIIAVRDDKYKRKRKPVAFARRLHDVKEYTIWAIARFIKVQEGSWWGWAYEGVINCRAIGYVGHHVTIAVFCNVVATPVPLKL